MKQYQRRERTFVTAVRLDLDTEGFTYQKWGGMQRCKRGDWILNNQGDVYTVDAESFARTYSMISPGVYAKTAAVWAEKTDAAGSIPTKEGATQYQAGDYLLYNEREKKDGYAVKAETFDALYEAIS